MGRIERGVWLTLVVLLLSITAVSGHQAWQGERALERARAQVRALQGRLQEMAPDGPDGDEPAGLTPREMRRLQTLGLAEPHRDLAADLRAHPELIPHDPVLGGRFFFMPGGVRVLNDRWVLAVFEDGHVRGQMLLEYSLHSGGIRWRVLASALDR
ncbi:hypothetical protein [Ectothiorhodospira mobilis]|uniref:hypothetical protein n=1 Tax=Ectothiorhodospira mobilis TaxID=195064 RepID=UPI001902CC5A|nr:hypothetical protein [Ectothiorhodospira mobilis]MBK1693003.1 hypothetical protein [Ectothiorhodospira mobilis]